MASIFVLIPAIVASGMVTGITNIVIMLVADLSSTLISILNVTDWRLFTYLSIFVGINAAKEFGDSPAMGGLAGILLIKPGITAIKIGQTALVPGREGNYWCTPCGLFYGYN